MQVADVIHLATETVTDRHFASKKIIIQLDNSIGFVSQKIIPFIFNMNTILHNKKKVWSRWIFTETQTGKTGLDTH